MRTDTTIRAVESIATASRNGRRVNGLFRLLANPDVLWKQAYANLYSNKGAITKGVNNTTLDGFSMDRVGNLIRLLYAKEYRFAPVRRTYIAKSNSKLRPLGIPTGDDKLVQEAVRIILERIYEPMFSSNSHGFRPKRSCHTALMQADKQWLGIKWIIEFDIKGFFDNIKHCKMIEILERKIDDRRVISLVRQMLKAGYMEEWKWNPSYSGTPQGGVISPMLANIYLHELDMFMERQMAAFYKGKNERQTLNMPHWQVAFGASGSESVADSRGKRGISHIYLLKHCIRKKKHCAPKCAARHLKTSSMPHIDVCDTFDMQTTSLLELSAPRMMR